MVYYPDEISNNPRSELQRPSLASIVEITWLDQRYALIDMALSYIE